MISRLASQTRWLGAVSLLLVLGGPLAADEELSRALASQYAAVGTENHPPQAVSSVAAIPDSMHQKQGHFREVFDREDSTSLDFIETPLREVIEFLADLHQIPIFIKEDALDEADISSDDPVTINVRNLSLRSALGLLLDQRNLDYLVANEVLNITTLADAQKNAEPRVYPVGDLIPNSGDACARKSLIEVLTTAVTPKDWDEDGGYASVVPFGDTLMIRHTYRGHEQVEQLLAAMRSALNGPGSNHRADHGDAEEQ